MKNKFNIITASALVATTVGCTTCKIDEPACSHEKVVKAEMATSSSDQIGMIVYPETQGPVDTFRPLYKVGDKKYTAKGVGDTEQQARANAIQKMCKSLNCDYVAAAKWDLIKKSDDINGTTFEANVIGFPIYITGVETIKAKFYEQQADGSLKEVNPEHKIVYSPAKHTWIPAMLGGDIGTKVDAKELSVISRKLSMESEKKVPYGMVGAESPAKER